MHIYIYVYIYIEKWGISIIPKWYLIHLRLVYYINFLHKEWVVNVRVEW